MDRARAKPWMIIALGAMTLLVLLFAATAWRGGGDAGEAVEAVRSAVPDPRPQLPQGPRLPDPPIPVPK